MQVCKLHDTAFRISCPACNWQSRAESAEAELKNTKNWLETERRGSQTEKQVYGLTIEAAEKEIERLRKANDSIRISTDYVSKLEKEFKASRQEIDVLKIENAILKPVKAEKPAAQPKLKPEMAKYLQGDRVNLKFAKGVYEIKDYTFEYGNHYYSVVLLGEDDYTCLSVQEPQIKCVSHEQEDTECGPWRGEDYAGRQIAWLKHGGDSKIHRIESLMITSMRISGMIYKYIEASRTFTLPNGSKLYRGTND